jgi:hypothetical protein
MGFTFLAPDPRFEDPPFRLPEFNIVRAMENEGDCMGEDPDPNLPPTAPPQSPLCLPAPQPADPNGEEKAKNWENVKKAWNAADLGDGGAAAELVSRWTAAFGWDDPGADVAAIAVPRAVMAQTGGGGVVPAVPPTVPPTVPPIVPPTVPAVPPAVPPPAAPAPVIPIPPFTPLVVKRPQHLVDNLETYYLGAPHLSSAAVAAAA